MAKIVEHFIITEPKNNIINITPSKSSSLKEIAEIVQSYSQKNINIKILNEGMNFEYTGDNTLLLNNFENLKFTSLEVGLKSLFNYIVSSRKEK